MITALPEVLIFLNYVRVLKAIVTRNVSFYSLTVTHNFNLRKLIQINITTSLIRDTSKFKKVACGVCSAIEKRFKYLNTYGYD